MNFYKRFCADIQVKTGHLTPAEFGIYDRLLDHYYATEALLPSFARCCAIARAMTKADRAATARVLAEFFTPEEGGLYSQGRADEIIAEAQPKIEAARTNGKHGGRPKRTHKKPTGFQTETQDPTQNVDSQKASQSQSSSSTKKNGAQAPALSGLESVPEQVMNDFKTLRRAKRLPLTQTAIDGLVREAGKAGMSVSDAVKTSVENSWAGFKADWVKTERQKKADIAMTTVPSDPRAEEAAARRREADAMTPEQKEAADKARRLAMAAIKNITPNKAAA